MIYYLYFIIGGCLGNTTYLSNMKIIINENHLGLLRRVGVIEDLIDPTMD